MLEPDLK
jgi:hypothetical protein